MNTTVLCTELSTCPIDIPGTLPIGFGFGTSKRQVFVDRNYKPFGFELESANVSSELSVTGYGAFLDDTVSVAGPIQLPYSIGIEDQPYTPVNLPMPNFAKENRQIILWRGTASGLYPTIFKYNLSEAAGVYPLVQAPSGGTGVGGYLMVSLRLEIFLQAPYTVVKDGVYYMFLLAQISTDWSVEHPTIPDAILETGTTVAFSDGVDPTGTSGSTAPEPAVTEVGSFQIVDNTRSGPDADWGTMPFYAQGTANGFSCGCVAKCCERYLPSGL